MATDLPDQRRLRALSHPVRLRLLSLLVDSPKSGTTLAKETDMSQAAISYHLRSLEAAGLVELDSTRSVRGGIEKLYRLPVGGGAAGAPETMATSATAVTAEVVRRLQDSAAGGWDVFGDAEVWVDPDTWRRISHAIADLMEELHAEATAPRARGSVHVSATTLLFQLPARKPRAAASKRERRQ